MKTKILQKGNTYIPTFKTNWYNRWKYISLTDCQLKVYNSYQEYLSHPKTNLIYSVEEAEKLLQDFIEKQLP